MPEPPRASASERLIILLIAAIQFVNILDFVMVMPMGPDFAKGLSIPESELGLIGGSYTASAAVAGLLASTFLDRLDRRLALGGAMLGLVLGTAAGGLAQGLPSLMAARVAAGMFGGPATALSFSVIADVIPPSRRGRAVGTVMAAFSVASILGVPMGLWLSERLGWRAPFFAVAGLGLLLSAGSVLLLPPLRGHLEGAASGPRASARELLSRPAVQLSYLMTATVMMAGFLIIPNISAYVQGNLGYPREDLKWLYFVGGLASFATLRLSGVLVDRQGSFRTGTVGSALYIAILALVFVKPPDFPLMPLFVSFMVALGVRNVAYNTLTTQVPRPYERARFQSLQSSIQHGASAAGAFLSAKLLAPTTVVGPDGSLRAGLAGMGRVALLSTALTAALPALLFAVERRVRRESPQAASPPAAPAVEGP